MISSSNITPTKMSIPIYSKMSIPIYAFLLHFSSSSCPNSNPGFSSFFHPSVIRESSTSVLVQWTKEHVLNIHCGDNFIIKYWPVRDPRRYKISDLLPLKVHYQDIVTPTFNYTKATGMFSFLARGLYLLKNSYSFQVVVTENRAIIGRSWYRDDGRDEDEVELEEDFNTEFNFETSLDAFRLKRKQPVETFSNGQIIKKEWPSIKDVIATKTISQHYDPNSSTSRRMFAECDIEPYNKNASDFVFILKNGNLTRKAIRDVLCTRSGKHSRRAGPSSKRTVVAVKRGVISSRKERLSVRKDRLPARKTVLSARTIRKLHQQNPAAARLFNYKKINSNK